MKASPANQRHKINYHHVKNYYFYSDIFIAKVKTRALTQKINNIMALLLSSHLDPQGYLTPQRTRA